MMEKDYYISNNEFRIYLESKKLNKKVITVNEVMDILNVSKHQAYYHLYKMNKKGLIKRLRNGLYFIYPDSLLLNIQNYVEDPLYLLMNLIKPYFASYYTALDLHGLAQRSINTFYLTTTKFIKVVKQETYIIKPVIVLKKYFFGYIQMEFGNGTINVSDLERTIIDIINRPELAHGYEDIIKSILDIDIDLDYSKFFKYLSIFNKKILYHRIGYLFDTPVFKSYLNVPKSFLDKLKGQIHSINYFDSANKSGIFNNNWKVVVPTEIQTIFDFY